MQTTPPVGDKPTMVRSRAAQACLLNSGRLTLINPTRAKCPREPPAQQGFGCHARRSTQRLREVVQNLLLVQGASTNPTRRGPKMNLSLPSLRECRAAEDTEDLCKYRDVLALKIRGPAGATVNATRWRPRMNLSLPTTSQTPCDRGSGI